MADTSKSYTPLFLSDREADRKKFLFHELLSAAIISLCALVATFTLGVRGIPFFIGLGATIFFLLSLSLLHKNYNLSLSIYLTSSVIMVYFMVFFLPNVKFSPLILVLIGINGFFYIKNSKKAILFLKICLVICVLTLVPLLWHDGGTSYNDLDSFRRNTWLNNITLIIFLIALIVKIFFLIQNYKFVLQYILEQGQSSQKSQTNYQHIFETNSLAIVNYDISELYEYVQQLKVENGVIDIRKHLNYNKDVITTLINKIKINKINSRAYEVIGTKDEKQFFKKFLTIYRQSVINIIYHELVALFEGATDFEAEISIVSQQEVYKHLKYYVKYPKNEDFTNVSYTYIDITDQQKIKQELRASNERYLTLYANAPVGIIVLDIDNLKRGLDCNEMLLNILGVDKHTALYGNMIVLSPEYQQDGVSTKERLGQIMTEFRANRKPMQFEWLFKNKDNTPIWTEITFSSLEWEGEMQSIMFIKDVTKQKRQQQLILQQLNVLNDKNEELEKYIASNLELENFAYIASHDLQAPLRTVISFTNLLERSLRGRTTKNQEEYMKFILDGTYHMRRLINDLLEFSRVNTTAIHLEKIKLRNVVEMVLMDMSSLIEEKNAAITCLNLDVEIFADKTKLRQLIQNLVNNALKFTVEGRDAELVISTEENKDFWKISIQDNGIGIKPEFQEQIFLLFKRLHGHNEYKGTGIGLALCKKIVVQHQGKIGVKSQGEGGSTFHFSISKNIQTKG
jgi:PAS domain S-box-containing protein